LITSKQALRACILCQFSTLKGCQLGFFDTKTQLTEEQKAKLAILADEDIDYSDIPALDGNR
jgi:hypothetical protein